MILELIEIWQLKSFNTQVKRQRVSDKNSNETPYRKAPFDNRPLYSCGLNTLAFEWMWGWRWACFDTNLLCFVMEIVPDKY